MPRSTRCQPISSLLSLDRGGSDAADVKAPTLAARGVLLAIAVYQVLFYQLFTGSCRFEPSCSRYAAEAVRTHGALRGSLLAASRLARCHPFAAPGIDPVPPPSRPATRNIT